MTIPAPALAPSFFSRLRLTALIYAIEADLRALVRDYLLPLVAGETLVAPIAEKLNERAAQEGLIQPPASSLVEFMDYGDSVPILNRHRELLPKTVAAAVREFTPLFETTVAIRNRVVHGRPLRTDDHSTLTRLVERLVASQVPTPEAKEVLVRLEEDPKWAPVVEIESSSATPTRT